MFWKYQPLWR